MKTPTDLALAALNGFKWLGNNLHNIRSLPDQFESFYKAALDDAEKAIAALSPAQDPIAPGHNPDKLTVSQVGEGWRLLDRDEALWYIQNNKQASQTEYWPAYQGHWHRFFDDKSPIGKTETYRTRLTREELAALDKPKPAWQLPAPPAGKRWHREDFCEADLPEGWRPLLEGEDIHAGDEWLTCSGVWQSQMSFEKGGLYSGVQKHRTRRPLPSTPVMVPWDFESAPMELKVKRKSDGRLARIDSCPDGVALFWSKNGNSWQQFTFAELLSDFVQLDGSPCGIVK